MQGKPYFFIKKLWIGIWYWLFEVFRS